MTECDETCWALIACGSIDCADMDPMACITTTCAAHLDGAGAAFGLADCILPCESECGPQASL